MKARQWMQSLLPVIALIAFVLADASPAFAKKANRTYASMEGDGMSMPLNHKSKKHHKKKKEKKHARNSRKHQKWAKNGKKHNRSVASTHKKKNQKKHRKHHNQW